MSSMSPEGNAAAGNTPRPRSTAPGRNASGAASRVAVDTRDLTTLKRLLTENVTAAEKLSKQLTGMDPAIKTLKAVNAELTQMRSLLGMSGGGGSRGGGGSIANANASPVPTATRQVTATRGRPAGSAYDSVLMGGGGSYTQPTSFGGGQPNINPTDPGAAPQSYSRRGSFSSYMSQPVSTRGNPAARNYAGFTRAQAGGTVLAASVIGGALKFGGSYGQSQMAPNMDRSLLTNRLGFGQGGNGSYTQQQNISVALNQAYARGSQGFADTTAAGMAVRQLGGGGSNALAFARSGGNIAALDPSFGAANSQQMAGQITGVRAQNKLRGLGITVQGTGTSGNSAIGTIDQYINMYERVNRHKLSYDEIESGNQEGYPLYRSISAIFGVDQIPAVLARWHQKNSALVASNMTNNLYNAAQTAGQAVNSLQVTANKGVVAGQKDFLSGKTAAANAANKILQASGGPGQAAIQGAVAAGMTLDALGGIKGTLDKMLAVMTGRTLAKTTTSLLSKYAPKALPLVKKAGVAGAIAGAAIELEPDAEGAWNSAMKGQFGSPGDMWTGKGASGSGRLISHMNNLINPLTPQNLNSDLNKVKKVGSYITGLFGGSAAGATSGGSTGKGQASAGGASGNPVQRAIGVAESFIGDPYRYGGASPQTSFDCSGLIQYSYGQVGIKLPRTADQQSRVGQAVQPGDVRAGDLLFFAGADGTSKDPGHVGMYIGGGKMIQSPHTGANIGISAANLANAVAIRRVANGGTAGSAMPAGTGVSNTASSAPGSKPSFSAAASFGGGSPDADLIAALGGSLAGRASYSNSNPTATATTTTGTTSTNAASNTGAAPSSGTGNVALAQKMAAARGWTGSQWNNLYALWQQESGFKTQAGAPRRAYGIPQSDPGSKMASAGNDWLTNPATQIKWGLDYIASTYGAPSGAQAHKHATDSRLGSHAYMAQPGGWYEKGSWNIVKDQLAALHKGEMVVPQKTANLLRTMVDSPGGASGKSGASGGGSVYSIKELHLHGLSGSDADMRKSADKFLGYIEEGKQLDAVAHR